MLIMKTKIIFRTNDFEIYVKECFKMYQQNKNLKYYKYFNWFKFRYEYKVISE